MKPTKKSNKNSFLTGRQFKIIGALILAAVAIIYGYILILAQNRPPRDSGQFSLEPIDVVVIVVTNILGVIMWLAPLIILLVGIAITLKVIYHKPDKK